MAVLDIFKKNKEGKEEKKKGEGSGEKTKEGSKRAQRAKAGVSLIAYRVLKAAHITEKATDLAEKNQYVFEIYPDTNKSDVKKAVENLYNVDVLDVKIINIPRKKRRIGKSMGWRKEYKKAIVKIRKDQKLELLPT